MIAILSGELEAHEEDERHQANDRNAFENHRQKVAVEEIKRVDDEVDNHALNKRRQLQPSHLDLRKKKVPRLLFRLRRPSEAIFGSLKIFRIFSRGKID